MFIFMQYILSCTGLTLNEPGDLAISLGTSDTVSKLKKKNIMAFTLGYDSEDF